MTKVILNLLKLCRATGQNHSVLCFEFCSTGFIQQNTQVSDLKTVILQICVFWSFYLLSIGLHISKSHVLHRYSLTWHSASFSTWHLPRHFRPSSSSVKLHRIVYLPIYYLSTHSSTTPPYNKKIQKPAFICF